MNAKFLESLKGKTVREAKAEIAQMGYEVEVYRNIEKEVIKSKENIIMLFERDGRVIHIK